MKKRERTEKEGKKGRSPILTWLGRTAGALLFLLLVWLVYRTAAYSLRPDDEGVRTRLEGFYGEEENSLDVVFVGSSAVYSFFSPLRLWEETGITSYLYATPNQTIPMIRYLLEECRKTQDDALYVIELRPMLASEEDKQTIAVDLRRLSDHMPYSWTRFQLIWDMMGRMETDDAFSYFFDLMKYHENWKEWSLDQLTLTWGKENPWKGWHFVSQWEPIQGQDWSRVNARIPVSEENETDLRALLRYCQEEELQVVFVMTPFALSRQQAKMYNSVGDIVEEYGYTFWNLCREIETIGLDFSRDYYDFRHTNTLGAIKCTTYLGKLLSEYGETHGLDFGVSTAELQNQWEQDWKEYQKAETLSIQIIEEMIQKDRGQGGE